MHTVNLLYYCKALYSSFYLCILPETVATTISCVAIKLINGVILNLVSQQVVANGPPVQTLLLQTNLYNYDDTLKIILVLNYFSKF